MQGAQTLHANKQNVPITEISKHLGFVLGPTMLGESALDPTSRGTIGYGDGHF
jgi:hypothetical protein